MTPFLLIAIMCLFGAALIAVNRHFDKEFNRIEQEYIETLERILREAEEEFGKIPGFKYLAWRNGEILLVFKFETSGTWSIISKENAGVDGINGDVVSYLEFLEGIYCQAKAGLKPWR